MRRVGFLMVALFSASALSAQEPPQRFDLVCSGQSERMNGTGIHVPLGSVKKVYHIDLDNSLWCEGACSVVLPITNAVTGLLTLRSLEMTDNPPQGELAISRFDGKWINEDVHSIGGKADFMLVDWGVCQRAIISKVPKVLF